MTPAGARVQPVEEKPKVRSIEQTSRHLHIEFEGGARLSWPVDGPLTIGDAKQLRERVLRTFGLEEPSP